MLLLQLFLSVVLLLVLEEELVLVGEEQLLLVLELLEELGSVVAATVRTVVIVVFRPFLALVPTAHELLL